MTDAVIVAPSSRPGSFPSSASDAVTAGGAPAGFNPAPDVVSTLSGMRVGFVLNYFPVLSEAFIAYAAAALVKCGTDLSLLPLYRLEAEDPPHAPIGILAGNDLSERVTSPRFSDEGMKRLIHAPAVILADALAQGPRAIRPFDRRLRVPYEREAFQGLDKFDVLHCQFGSLAAPILQHRREGTLQGRLVVHFRGYDITKWLTLFGSDFYTEIFDCADRFLTNCDHFKQKLIEMGCREDLIDVAPSGLDLSAFPFSPQPKFTNERVRLLTVGRLTEKKGIGDGIHALSIARKNGIDAHYRIIGEGHLRDELEALVASLGLSEFVDLPGAMPHDKVKSEFQDADIFLAPSITAADGDQDAPVNTLKEAMALGVPVIATQHGGIPELVHDGQNGLLAPERDPETLAKHISRLASESDLADRFIEAARQEVEARWSLEYATKVYAEAYTKALAAPPRDPVLKTSS